MQRSNVEGHARDAGHARQPHPQSVPRLVPRRESSPRTMNTESAARRSNSPGSLATMPRSCWGLRPGQTPGDRSTRTRGGIRCTRRRSRHRARGHLREAAGRSVRPPLAATRWMPAAARSFGLTRMSGPPPCSIFGRALRPIGVSTVRMRWNTTRSTRRTSRGARRRPSMRNGTWPVSRPAIHVLCRAHGLERNLRPGVPRTDDEHVPGRSCAGLR